jgi:signal transduction histidine kinase
MPNLLTNRIINSLYNIGIDSSLPKDERTGIRILNLLSGMSVILLSIYTVFDIYLIDFTQGVVGIYYVAVLALVLLANYYRVFEVSKFIFSFIIPISLCITIILYDAQMRPEFCYSLFFVGNLILYKSKKRKYWLNGFLIFLYLFSTSYQYYFPNPNGLPYVLADIILLFLITNAIIIVSISFFIKEKSKYQKKLIKTLAQLKKNNQELQVANDELERFAYIASHDLKTPLRTIVSFLNLIEKKIAQGDYENIQDYISYAKQGGTQMSLLVGEILEFSRINMNEDTLLEDIDLNEIIAQNINNMKSLTIDKNAQIISENLPNISSNRLYVSLLFQNLIENGLKYNESKYSTVHIKTENDQEYTHIFFKDNGIGIPKEYHDRIFNLFERLHNSDTYAGTGMGLAICKKAIEKINGKIRLESDGKNGSTFIVSIPKNLTPSHK